MENSPKFKILVADPVSQSGVDALAGPGDVEVIVQTGLKEAELLEIIPDISALVVRSQTKVTAAVFEAAKKLKVVGRAGVGVDNVDIEAATKHGVIVMNTPGGNTISTAEHAFSLMVSIARKVPHAHVTMLAGRWDRKLFEGVELYGKTLAILGMGRIGTEFARRAIAFGMRVIAYDPYLAASRARALQVELIEDLDSAVAAADFITLHMPLTPETTHMLDARRLALAKPGVRIVNCARGGLIDEAALMEALESGQVAGAALDVYEEEPPAADAPIRSAKNLIMTPHLGASTAEAQESVGIEIAEAIRDALLTGAIRNAVNMPNLDSKTLAAVGPYLTFGEQLGRFLSQAGPRRPEYLRIQYSGRIAEETTTPVSRAILKGFLEAVGGADVNVVNAPALAETLGMKLEEIKSSTASDFAELVRVTTGCESKESSVAGTFFGNKARIVMIDERHIETRPEGVVLLLENRDRPGIVGQVGSLMGAHGVNIAHMSLSRKEVGGKALTALNLDSKPSEALLSELLSDPDIYSAKVISL